MLVAVAVIEPELESEFVIDAAVVPPKLKNEIGGGVVMLSLALVKATLVVVPENTGICVPTDVAVIVCVRWNSLERDALRCARRAGVSAHAMSGSISCE